jgi:hypothetical protein
MPCEFCGARITILEVNVGTHMGRCGDCEMKAKNAPENFGLSFNFIWSEEVCPLRNS